MITEIGAVKVRGGEVLGEFQTLVNPHRAIPPFIAVLTGITDSMVAGSPRIEQVLPPVPRVRPGLRAGGPQRAVRRRVPAALRRAAGPAVAAVRGARHRQARPPGDHPRRRAQLQAQLASRRCSAPTTTPNHRALVGRPGHGRRAARADGPARQPRRAHARGAADLQRTGHARRSGASGTWPSTCRTPPASTSSRTTRGRVLYVGTSRDLRTRVRTYFTASETRSRMGEMVGLADDRARHRVRDPARGRGPRAPADRPAQAALQPPLALPRAGALDQADPRAVAAAVAGAARPRRRRRLPRPLLLQAGGRAVPSPRCTRPSRSGSAAAGCPRSPR